MKKLEDPKNMEAHAVARWCHSRSPDEVGAITDAIWSLGKAAPELCPDLVEHARKVMEIEADAEARDPRSLVNLAELLEHAAEKLKTAARVLGDSRSR